MPHGSTREGHEQRENSDPKQPDAKSQVRGSGWGRNGLGADVHKGHQVVSADDQPGGAQGTKSLGLPAPMCCVKIHHVGCSPRRAQAVSTLAQKPLWTAGRRKMNGQTGEPLEEPQTLGLAAPTAGRP